jgi:hypothetical protein
MTIGGSLLAVDGRRVRQLQVTSDKYQVGMEEWQSEVSDA